MASNGRRGRRSGVSVTERADGRFHAAVPWRDEYGTSHRTFVYGRTISEVLQKVGEVQERLRRGSPISDSGATLESYALAWIDTTLAVSDRKNSTKALYGTLMRTHVVGSRLGARPLRTITPSHIERWIAELKLNGKAPSTVRQIYTVLRAILDTAVRDRLLAINPAAAVPRPRVERTEAGLLTTTDLHSLLAAASRSRYLPFFEFLAHTGLRRGEAMALRWSDVDLTRRILRIEATLSRVDGELIRTSTKTARSRRQVPISPRVASILKSLRERQRVERVHAGSEWVETPFVFTTETGQASDPRNALRAFKESARKAGLDPSISLHSLRHTAASIMLENGIPLKLVSEVLGHSSVAITGDVYGHVTPQATHAALSHLGALLEQKPEPESIDVRSDVIPDDSPQREPQDLGSQAPDLR